MKIPCSITRDLLPLYAEKMVERETEELIDEHLAQCEACRQKLSEIRAEAAAPIETTQPLKALKREIRRRRWLSAAVAALLVFVAVFTYFHRANEMRLIPWEDGLVEVVGTEMRARDTFAGDALAEDEPAEDGQMVEVLVINVDNRINGVTARIFPDEEGTTVQIEGWSSHFNRQLSSGEYHEHTIYPVPDRVVYVGSDGQKLLWGEEANGGVEVLPRLALAYYVIIAAIVLVISGAAWLITRRGKYSWIARQVFFAPVSYLLAHLLIKGTATTSFFLPQDFIAIVLIAAALYALLTCLWQIWLQHRKDMA